MYKEELVDLIALLPLCGEKSIKALRSRATEGVLHFVKSDGARHLYDKQLSIVRCQAGRACKRPGSTWSDIAPIFRKQGAAINNLIVERLNAGDSEADAVILIQSFVSNQIQ